MWDVLNVLPMNHSFLIRRCSILALFILNLANIPKELSRISIMLSNNFTIEPLSCGIQSNGLMPFKFEYICYSDASLIILRHTTFCHVSHISYDISGNLLSYGYSWTLRNYA